MTPLTPPHGAITAGPGRRPLALVLGLGFVLSACPGGDGDPTQSPTEVGATPTATPAGPTPTPTAGQAERGKVSVLVRDVRDRPLAGVSVSIAGGLSRLTGSDGRIVLEDLPETPLALGFSKGGYAPSFKRVTPIAQQTLTMRVRLQPEAKRETFIAQEGYRFGDYSTGLRLVIPPGSLVTETGAAYTGEAEIGHTALSLTGAGLASVPGSLLGVDPGGDPKPLSAFAAIVFDLKAADGQPLKLGPGASASLELPLADESSLALGATVPGWLYDPAEGAYRPAISSVVSQSSLLSDVNTVSLSITSLAPWVVARSSGGAWLSGRVAERGTVTALVGAEVRIGGGYPAIFAEARVKADGTYCLRAPASDAFAVEGAVDVGGVVFTRSAPAATGLAECAGVGVEPLGIPLAAGCVGGRILDGEGGPLSGLDVWSDAGTADKTDAQGAFCVLGPEDRAVSVHAEGYSSRSIRPTAGGMCSETGAPACEAQLTFQPPLAQWLYRMNALALAEQGEGLDLTGDGIPDNAMAKVFTGFADAALAQVETILQQKVREGVLTQEQADQYYAKAEAFFSQFEGNGGSPVQYLTDRGSIIWLLRATVIGDGATLEILQGDYDGVTFTPGQSVASLTGAEAAGDISVGPADLSFTLPPEDFFISTEGTSTLRVYGARSVGTIGPEGLAGGMLGGIIPTSDIIAAAYAFIPESLELELGGVALPTKEDIIASIQATLDANADTTVGGQDAISFTMDFGGVPLGQVACESGYWVDELVIAPPGDGPDIDGDGDGDSDMEALLGTIDEVFEQAFYDQLVAYGIPPRIAESTAESVAESIALALGLENANSKMADTLGSEAAVPIFILSESDPVVLEAWAGTFTGDGYGRKNFKWSLEGIVDHGALIVEAPILYRSFDITTPLGGETVIGTVTFHEPRISALITRFGMEEGRQVYTISVAEILRLTELVIDSFTGLGAVPDTLGAPFLDYFEAALLSSAGVNLGGDIGPAYALSYRFSARSACLDPSSAAPPPTPTPMPMP